MIQQARPDWWTALGLALGLHMGSSTIGETTKGRTSSPA
jgi:hypothetical protein